MIYAMQAVEGGPVKIGFSRNVDARRKALEAHYGKPLAVLAIFEGGREDEKEIHKRFDHLRIDGTGARGARPEQFRPAADLMEFLGRPLLVAANPDAVEAMPTTGKAVAVISLRGSQEFADWLESIHRKTRIQKTVIVRLALNEWAAANGFEPFPLYPDPPKR